MSFSRAAGTRTGKAAARKPLWERNLRAQKRARAKSAETKGKDVVAGKKKARVARKTTVPRTVVRSRVGSRNRVGSKGSVPKGTRTSGKATKKRTAKKREMPTTMGAMRAEG